MIRATTPTHTFTFPTEVHIDDAKEVLISYAQNGKVVFERNKEALEPVSGEENTYKYMLTQEETRMLVANIPVEIQVRVLTNLNEAFASQIFTLPVSRVLDDEVLG